MDHTSNPYIQACKLKVSDYLEGATRFGAQAISFTRESTESVEVLVAVTHSLTTDVTTEDRVGPYTAALSELGFPTEFDYTSAVESAQREELGRAGNLEALEKRLPSLSYAQASEGLVLRPHAKRLFHTHKCKSCLGSGAHDCKTCVGKGKEGCPDCGARGAQDCTKCGGNGKLKCSSCSGSGKTKCPKCHGSRTRPNPDRHDDFYASNTLACDYCGGSGHLRCRKCTGLFSFRSGKIKCRACKGKGSLACKPCKGKKQITCRTCSGQGSHPCHDCEGKGCFTSISQVALVTVPVAKLSFPGAAAEAWREVIEAVPPADLGRLGELRYIGTEIDREGGAATLRYSIRIPVCELESQLNGESSTWLLVGDNPEIKKGGFALETLLAEDLNKLASLSDLSPYSISYKTRAAAVLKITLESELNQQLVDNLNPAQSEEGSDVELDFDYGRLAKSVDGVVSENYVATLVYSIWQVCEGAVISSVMRAGLLAAALAPILMFMLVSGFVQVFGLEVEDGADRLVVFSTADGIQMWVGLTVGALTAWGLANLAITLHGGWLKRIAGKQRTLILREANNAVGVLVAKIGVAVLAAASTWAMYRVFPLWLDLNGQYYGLIPSMALLSQM
jgi:hypothetical protein